MSGRARSRLTICGPCRSSAAAASALGAATTCSNASTSANPCIAFILPETTYGDATGTISRYVQLAYRYEARTDFADRRANPWADDNSVEVIREYRRVLSVTCGASCTNAQLQTATGTAWTSAVLADGLTRQEGAGTFAPWMFRPPVATTPPTATAAPASARDVLEIKIRSLYKRGSSGVYFPTAAPRTLSVQNRNGT